MKVNIIDNDLLSIQEARILTENAYEAQQKLATFPQEKLDVEFPFQRHDLAAEGRLRQIKLVSGLGEIQTGRGGEEYLHLCRGHAAFPPFCHYTAKDKEEQFCRPMQLGHRAMSDLQFPFPAADDKINIKMHLSGEK